MLVLLLIIIMLGVIVTSQALVTFGIPIYGALTIIIVLGVVVACCGYAFARLLPFWLYVTLMVTMSILWLYSVVVTPE